MSDNEPLDPALRDLLDLAEGDPPAPPDGAMERVLDKVTSAPAAPAGGTGAAAGSLIGPALIGAVAVILAAVVALWPADPVTPRPAPPSEPSPSSVVREVVEVPASPPETKPEASSTSVAEPVKKAPRKVRKKVRKKTSTLDAERALLDDARVALAARDAAKANELLESYDARFARGVLAEERAAFEVWRRSLVDKTSAAAAADDFRARYPKSLHRGLVDAISP
jgi:hypothetical protein